MSCEAHYRIDKGELCPCCGLNPAKVRELVEAVASMIKGWPDGIMIQRRQFERIDKALAALEEKP